MTESVVEVVVQGWLDLALEGDHVCGSVREMVPADHGDVKARDEESQILAATRDAPLLK